MHWGYRGLHILKIERSLGREAVLCKVVVKGSAKKDAIDEEIERHRPFVLKDSIDEA